MRSRVLDLAAVHCAAPIQEISGQYFNVSALGVNIFSMSFLALFFPGTMMASFVT
jgi:hypothetical protein